MSLDGALSIAGSGLTSIATQLALISQNVANAGTPDYAVEIGAPQSLQAGGAPEGVRSGPIMLASDPALQAQLATQTASSAYASTLSSALSTLAPALGTVANADDLGSALGTLQNAFSGLLNDPSNASQQAATVSAAASLAGKLNTLSAGYTAAGQAAQDGLQTDVRTLDGALTQIGALSDQIVALRAQGQSTADLENQRNAVTATVASLVDVRFVPQSDGDLQVFTAAGTALPTRGSGLSLASATYGPGAAYPATLPGIMLGGSDVTAELTGGSIGAQLALRDTTVPIYQAEADEFAHTLADRCDAQGLTLFTTPAGVLPVASGPPAQAGYIGFSAVIGVNPAVAASPALVRDGTRPVLAGDPGGASAFMPNPQNLAGFTDLITRVLDYAFGSQSQAGLPQPAVATLGLGSTGTVAAPFAAPATLADFATALTSTQAADTGNAATGAADAKAVQSALQDKLTGETGVSMDTEMSLLVTLQNAYGANAKVVSAVQSMFTAVLAMVQ